VCIRGSWVNSFFPDTPVSLFGNHFGLGGATFFWNGLGRVIIASGYDAVLGTFPIWADGELTATSSLGSVSFNEANPANTKVYGDDGLDITSILIPNAINQINLTITASGQYYGWSRLNLYQTNIINDGYHGFGSGAFELVNDLATGKKHLNPKYRELALGTGIAISGVVVTAAGIILAPETGGASLYLSYVGFSISSFGLGMYAADGMNTDEPIFV
jgi:hypothetical protein